jgi:hypothetical protein
MLSDQFWWAGCCCGCGGWCAAPPAYSMAAGLALGSNCRLQARRWPAAAGKAQASAGGRLALPMQRCRARPAGPQAPSCYAPEPHRQQYWCWTALSPAVQAKLASFARCLRRAPTCLQMPVMHVRGDLPARGARRGRAAPGLAHPGRLCLSAGRCSALQGPSYAPKERTEPFSERTGTRSPFNTGTCGRGAAWAWSCGGERQA